MSDETTTETDPTEPVTTTETPKPKRRGRPKKKGVTVKGSDFTPDLSPTMADSLKEYYYWTGLTRDCPVETLHCAGVIFHKLGARVVPDPMKPSNKMHEGYIGLVTKMNARQFKQLKERAKKIVIRTTRNILKDPITGEPRAIGQPITIKTKAEVEERRKAGIAAIEYVYKEGDEPASQYMFAVYCQDQNVPFATVSNVYPETIDKAGIFWPEEL